MATQIDDPELSLARDRVRSFEEKSQKLRSEMGTLDKNGEPKLTATRGGPSRGPRPRPSSPSEGRGLSPNGSPHEGNMGLRENAAVRRDMQGGPSLEPQLNDGMGDPTAYITGKEGGHSSYQAPSKNWDSVSTGGAKKREALVQPSSLHIPAARSKRIENKDGATSFHFSHEAVSKTNGKTTTASGKANRKGAAKDHVGYIERDGAVAKMVKDEEKSLDKIEQELEEIAKSDPELAERLGLKPEKSEEEKEALSTGALAGIYIEREEALAFDDNGSAALFTNISEDPIERRNFWQEVEKRESTPSEDRMRILMKGHEEFWKKIAEDERCPKPLRQAVEAAEPEDEVVVRTGDNEAIRKLMMQYGWRPREKRSEEETDEEREAREEREAQKSFGARFEDGRGGRVQFRVVGELPYDVEPEARVRILKGFAKEFEKRNLPYIAVIHSPDHTNDDRNWHFHLVYHDRPASRFTGKVEDHMRELPKNAGPKKVRQHELLKKALNDPKMQEHVGKWDFSVPFEYTQACRHRVTAYPFTQDKSREVNNRKFIPNLRKKLAELTNRELEAAGKRRRLDPRRYSEMGIHKRPDVHLGTQASQLEAAGVPTAAGIMNEESQWDYIQQNLKNQRQQTEREIDRKLNEWNKSLAVSDLSDSEKEKAEKEMIRWEQESRKAAEHHAIALNLQEHYDRLESRARKLEHMAKKHLDAIKEGRATRRQSSNSARYTEKLQEAQAHMLGLRIFMADEIGQISSSEISGSKHQKTANDHYKNIEEIIGKGKELRRERENSVGKKSDAQTNSKSQAKEDGLSKSDIDGFIRRVMDRKVRLVKEDGLIVPRVQTAKDKEIIASNGYERTQKRLEGLKAGHDRLVKALQDGLSRNPRMIVAKKVGNVAETTVKPSETLRLATKDKKLQQAWRMFADEPDVVEEINKAINKVREQQRSRNAQTSASADNQNSKNSQVKDPTETTNQKSSSDQLPASENKNEKPATQRKPDNQDKEIDKSDVEGKNDKDIGKQDGKKTEPSSQKTEDKKAFDESRGNASKSNKEESIQPDTSKSSSATVGTKPTNKTEIEKTVDNALQTTREKFLRPVAVHVGKRLEVSFSKEDAALYNLPKTIVIEDKRTIARMEGVLSKHDRAIKRIKGYLAKNPSAAQEVKQAGDSPLNDKAPKDLVTLAKNHSRDPQLRRIIEDAVIKSRLDKVDPRNIGTQKKEESVKITSEPAQDKSIQIESSGKAKVEETKTKKVETSSAETKEDTVAQPKKKEAEEEKKAEQPSLFGPGSKNLFRPQVEEVDASNYGARKVAGKDDAAQEEQDNKKEEKEERKPRLIISDKVVEQGAEQTFERVPTMELKEGIHPKLDAWIKAEKEKDRDAREKAAALIRGDRHLLSDIDKMDPQVRARLQRDWDGVDERREKKEREIKNQQDQIE